MNYLYKYLFFTFIQYINGYLLTMLSIHYIYDTTFIINKFKKILTVISFKQSIFLLRLQDRL